MQKVKTPTVADGFINAAKGYAELTKEDVTILRPIVELVTSGKVTKNDLLDMQLHLRPGFRNTRKLKPGEAGTAVMSRLGLALAMLFNNFGRLIPAANRHGRY